MMMMIYALCLHVSGWKNRSQQWDPLKPLCSHDPVMMGFYCRWKWFMCRNLSLSLLQSTGKIIITTPQRSDKQFTRNWGFDRIIVINKWRGSRTEKSFGSLSLIRELKIMLKNKSNKSLIIKFWEPQSVTYEWELMMVSSDESTRIYLFSWFDCNTSPLFWNFNISCCHVE